MFARQSGRGAQWICAYSYKNIVSAGDQADAFIVPAQLDGQIALFLVERAAADVSTRGYGTQDGSRAADLQLAKSPGHPHHHRRPGRAGVGGGHRHRRRLRLRRGSDGSDLRRHLRLPEPAPAVWRGNRQLPGPMRHRAADMKMQLELALHELLRQPKLGALPRSAAALSSRAKVQLGQSMRFVGQQAVQLSAA